jgi:glycosyltransferase involved in cell wall biosynthesis
MPNSPLLTILLPTHNRGDVISFAIESVLKQTVSNFELFIVGDGCTDDTEKIVQKFVQKDSRVQWFPFAKGKGFGYEYRNTVLKKARGKYTAFAAHDDLWFPDHLEKLLTFLNDHPEYLLAYTRPLWITPEGVLLPSIFNTDNQSTKKTLLEYHNEIPANCVIHRSDAMKKVGYWNSSLPQAADWDLWKRIIQTDKHQQIGFLPAPTALHFRAQWRTLENSMDEDLHALAAYILSNKDLSKTFTIEPSNTQPLQETLWKYIQNESWRKQLNQNITALFDLRLHELTQQNKKIEQEKEKLKIDNSQLHAVIENITHTPGYRFLDFLRKLLQR